MTPAPARATVHRLLRHGRFWLGGGTIALVLLLSLIGPTIIGQDPTQQDLAHRLTDPFWGAHGTSTHILGTDQLGRDTLARLLAGARVSLFIGVATVIVSGTIGTLLGLLGGYFGGRVDLAVNFIVTIRLTLPVVLVALVVVAMVGSSLTILVLVIGLLLWDRFAVVTRSATQRLAHSDFVIAARCIGSSTPRILLAEILPNITGPLIVVATIELAHAILLEAALSFLGLGVKPPLASWGLMVAEAKSQLLFRPWQIAIPGVALALLVLAVNLLGDALRDVLAPEGRV
ncbi:MAG TPA: ABC transporter permease [Aliidongia sp.]|uniref:ABC transporter permease n=1 Tax=Aliidongia sp. TaxID=1914230 RepID=UPI002DDD79C4|nr:ABC transporter permease [Aliidongia sp.]HEV2672893.1 ABC transporter permease [Aliidongia sp.]